MIRLLLLCFAWYCSVDAANIPWSLGSTVPEVPPLIRARDAANAQEDRQDAATATAQRVRVKLARGRSAVALAGEVRGYAIIDYVLAANSAQRLAVRLVGASQYLLMAIHAPGGEAVCVETCDRQWTGQVRHSGDYTIRVGLVRAEARRQGRAGYTLHIDITR